MTVLTSKLVQEGIASILDSLSRSDLEGAKRRIHDLTPEVRSDKERGRLFAVAGIYASLAKAKEGTIKGWDSGRVQRAANSISSSQMADEFDAGYAETLLNYSRLTQSSQQSAQ
jgi:hypothetical protein